MIKTPIFEHFGNINEKYTEMNYHNLGLGATARYRLGYLVKTSDSNFVALDNTGSFMSTIVSRSSVEIKAAPSRGYVMSKRGSSNNTIFEKIDPRTGEVIGSITVPGSYHYNSFDIYENGDILIFNGPGYMIYLYDYLLQLKASAPITYGGDFASKIYALTKWGKFVIANERNSKSSLYNKSDLSTIVLNNLFKDLLARTLTEQGWIWWNLGTSVANLYIQKIDFVKNEIISTSSISIKNGEYSFPYVFMNNIGVDFYFAQLKSYLVLIKINTKTEKKEIINTNIPYNQNTDQVIMMDDKHIVTADSSGYKFYKTSDFSLDFTYSTSYDRYSKLVYTTKGQYQNFGKYW